MKNRQPRSVARRLHIRRFVGRQHASLLRKYIFRCQRAEQGGSRDGEYSSGLLAQVVYVRVIAARSKRLSDPAVTGRCRPRPAGRGRADVRPFRPARGDKSREGGAPAPQQRQSFSIESVARALTVQDWSSAPAVGGGARIGDGRIDQRGLRREDQLLAPRGAPELEFAREGEGLAGCQGLRSAAGRPPRARRGTAMGVRGRPRPRSHADHHGTARRGKEPGPPRAVGDGNRIAVSRLDGGLRGRPASAGRATALRRACSRSLNALGKGSRSSAGTEAPGAASRFRQGFRRAAGRFHRRPADAGSADVDFDRLPGPQQGPDAAATASPAGRRRRGSFPGPAPTRRARRVPAEPPGSPARPARGSRRRPHPRPRAPLTTRERSDRRENPAGEKDVQGPPGAPGEEYSARPATSSRVTPAAPRPNLIPSLITLAATQARSSGVPDPERAGRGSAGRGIPAQAVSTPIRSKALLRPGDTPLIRPDLGEYGVEGERRVGALEPLPGGALFERRAKRVPERRSATPRRREFDDAGRAAWQQVDRGRGPERGDPGEVSAAAHDTGGQDPKTKRPARATVSYPRVRDAARSPRSGRPVFSAMRRQSSYSGAHRICSLPREAA